VQHGEVGSTGPSPLPLNTHTPLQHAFPDHTNIKTTHFPPTGRCAGVVVERRWLVAELLQFDLESNYHNKDAVAVTLYFDEKPTEDEVRKSCEEIRHRLPLSVDLDSSWFSWEECPTALSDAAGWVRVQAHPTC